MAIYEPSREKVFEFIKDHLPKVLNDVLLKDIDSEISQTTIERYLSIYRLCEGKSQKAMAMFIGLVPVLEDLLRATDKQLETAVIKNKALCEYFGVPESYLFDNDEITDPESEKKKIREKFTLINCANG